MKKKILPIIIAGLLLAALVIGLILNARDKKIHLSFPGTVGNSAGNLNNNGIFVEKDGVVYFSNPYDRGTIYTMSPDETHIQKFLDVPGRLLNVDDYYLYYFQTLASGASGLGHMRQRSGICRYALDGKRSDVLSYETCYDMQLTNNTLYYLVSDEKGPRFCKLRIDEKEPVVLAKEIINPSCVYNGRIYYNGNSNDHELYSLDPSTDVVSSVWAGNVWDPIVMDNYVYYMDISNDYRLCRYDMLQGVIEILTHDRVDFYNIGGGKIFYQKSSKTSPALIRMNLDGSEAETIAEGVFCDINMTSQYVYYRPFGSEVPLYHVSINGPAIPTTFDSARSASIAK